MNPLVAKKLGIQPFRPSDYLLSPAECQDYLLACLEEAPNDTALIRAANEQINLAQNSYSKADCTNKKF